MFAGLTDRLNLHVESPPDGRYLGDYWTILGFDVNGNLSLTGRCGRYARTDETDLTGQGTDQLPLCILC